MEIMIYYTLMMLVLFLGVVLVIGKPWTFIGIKLFIAKLKYKQNAAALLLINKAGDISRVIGIDLAANRYSIKSKKGSEPKDYVYSKDQVQQGRFMGLPYILYNEDDTKTTVGLYYQQSDEETGEPLILNVEGLGKIPYLSALKPSVSLSPSFFQALVGDHTLTMALKDFIAKNKQILIAAGIGVIAAAAAAFFAFEMVSTHVPVIVELLRGIDTKVTEILEILRAI